MNAGVLEEQNCMDVEGFEPSTSRMQSVRATTVPNALNDTRAFAYWECPNSGKRAGRGNLAVLNAHASVAGSGVRTRCKLCSRVTGHMPLGDAAYSIS